MPKKDIKIHKIEIDLSPKMILGILLMFLALFVLPVNIVYYMNNPLDVGPSVAGLSTNQSGRYYNIPIINFAFDTQLREPSTISFVFGAALLIISIIMIIVFFVDFRHRERKYKN
jgi:hypothetical protein